MRALLSLCMILGLVACDPATPPDSETAATIPVDQRMGNIPDPGFARALQVREFSFPRDHGPHPEYATEWWYFTGNLRTPDGRRFGYQLTLFRIGLQPGTPTPDSAWRTRQIYMGHLAISDIARGQHHSAERFARAAAGLAGAELSPLRVWLGPWSIRGDAHATFPLRLSAQDEDFAIDLQLARGSKPRIDQGDQGLSQKGAAPGNASYYYSFTRLPTQGEIRIGAQRFTVIGESWFDREWSSSALAPDQAGWDWFALQLADGRDLMYYQLRGKDGAAQTYSSGVLISANGSRRKLQVTDVKLEPTRYWQTDDGIRYPIAWRLAVPDAGLDLQVAATFDDQEMRHSVRYWEGAVRVSGSHGGVGYLELSGYAR